MEEYITKAKTLIESLPYIQRFAGKTVVIKYGGSAMIDDDLKLSVIKDIVLMKLVGLKPIIVHGGGKEISYWMSKLNKQSQFIDGFRVTDEETMEIAEMILSGKVNKSLVQLMFQQGMKAVGISGKDGATIKVNKKYINGKDIGFVGDIKTVNTELLNVLLESDFIPIVAPIGLDDNGDSYNINADDAAGAIASAMNAEKLVFLTDVEGVLLDPYDQRSLISEISVDKAEELIQDGVIAGGMIPKIKCCINSVKNNVTQVHILDGRVDHSLLLEIFTEKGIGTMMVK
ncbi:N-acetylglutamate kinase [Natranaerovirga hydrolytica]|uniref:Acetylglutamate kinase n=1 Tax=Natranaerovirga hydrolytica TaxID=680378 RepID=A0A4V2Q1P3_9FIRM|nr:acetylglutamate kinase [Natranaerovirga hydrolytica]TCK98421.1 N-acetylglutamate kinase [Natranaerovirga hydrolytica]